MKNKWVQVTRDHNDIDPDGWAGVFNPDAHPDIPNPTHMFSLFQLDRPTDRQTEKASYESYLRINKAGYTTTPDGLVGKGSVCKGH